MSTLRQVITDKFIVIDRVHMSQGNLKIYHKKSYRTKNWIFIIGINENKILQKTMDAKANIQHSSIEQDIIKYLQLNEKKTVKNIYIVRFVYV